ncbi:unnamed protein product [Caenorhabditis bovis]|uniref:Transmembrane protein 208 n=1 Tax=Caenorhabditis bovis TaxID=2654633 RepID=A0A8S1F1G1_9PELO|nr:unnamed protein product [Caenorhabditis bovis]
MVKQATKGQKVIYEENQQTIFYYSTAVLISILIRALVEFIFGSFETSFVSLFAVSIFIQILSVVFMRKLAAARFDEKGHVTDAGADLNDPEAFGEYCKDTIILTVITQLLTTFTNYAFLLLLAFPAFAGYKLFFGIILPWLTAPSEAPEIDDKKQRKLDRKREKVVYRR